MLNSFIYWLATRFLTKGKIMDLFIDKIFGKEDPNHVLRTLFQRHNTSPEREKGDVKNLNIVALNHLLKVFGTGELMKLVLFKVLKEQRYGCPYAGCDIEDLQALIVKLDDNKATNKLARLAEFKRILRDALRDPDAEEIAVLAQICMNVSTFNQATYKFLEEI